MNRNHFYTYTVGVRTIVSREILNKKGVGTGEFEDVTTWPLTMVTRCANLHDVAGRLGKSLDDIRYERKVIER